MAHTKFTFTFPTGVAGGRVTFNADTYDDPQVNRPTRGELDLREPRTRDGVTFTDPWIIVYSDAASLTATTTDAAGNPLTATATTGSPVAAGPAAGSGTTPGSQPSAASVVAPDWQPSTAYKAKQLVWRAGQLHRAKAAFTSGSSFSASNWDAVGSGASLLTPTAVKTAAYTAAAGDFVPVDTTGGNVTVTLPTAPADKTQVAVKQVARSGINTVTVAAGGTDKFNVAGGSATFTLTAPNQSVTVQYAAASGLWYVVANDLPLSQVVQLSTAPGDTQTGPFAVHLNQSGVDNEIHDLIDLRNRSLGDGIAVYNFSGKDASFAGTTGNMTGFLSIVPYYKDIGVGSGWDGTTLNDKVGQSGAWIIQEVFDASVRGLQVDNYGHGDGIQLNNQPNDGHPRANDGTGLSITDAGTGDSIKITRLTTPAVGANPMASNALIRLVDVADSTGTAPAMMIKIRDYNAARMMIDSQGTIKWQGWNINTGWGTTFGPMSPADNTKDGVMLLQGALEIGYRAAGTASNPTNGIKKQAAANNILQFYTAGSIVMDLRNGNQFGVFGSAQAKQTITGSRGSATATVLASLLTALAGFGFITDSTTA